MVVEVVQADVTPLEAWRHGVAQNERADLGCNSVKTVNGELHEGFDRGVVD